MRRLGREIGFILLIKLVALWGLWYTCFSERASVDKHYLTQTVTTTIEETHD